MNKENKCPWCQHEANVERDPLNSKFYGWGKCGYCGAQGPVEESESEALAAFCGLGRPSEPAPGTVRVRLPVHVSPAGDWVCDAYSIRDSGVLRPDALDAADNEGREVPVIVEADVPLPMAPVVRGMVR